MKIVDNIKIPSIHHKSIIKLLIVLVWTLLLNNSASYFSVYVICGICATVAIIKGEKIPLKTRLTRVLIRSCSAAFSVLVLLSNYELFLPAHKCAVEIALCLTGGYLVAKSILCFLYTYLPSNEANRTGISRTRSTLSFLIPFFVFTAIYTLYFLFSAYPGNISTDALDQIGQAINGLRSNHHPIWHTLVIKLIISIGMSLFGNITAAVALYCVCQMIFMSSAFAFSISTLYRAGVKPIHLFFCSLPFAIMPYHIVFSVSIWKDVVFAGAALYMITFVFRILNRVGNMTINYIFTFVFTVLFCVWRTNAWIAMVISVPLFLIYLKRKHLTTVLIVAIAVIVSWGMRSPFMYAIGVKQPDFAESLSIPLQQIARVIVDDGYISDSDKELLNRIMDIDEIDSIYKDYISDPIKYEVRSKDPDYLEKNKLRYLGLWIRIGINNPDSYIKAWVDQTKGYYNSGYNYWIVLTGVEDNEHGIENVKKSNVIDSGFNLLLYKMNTHVLFEPFISIGLAVWAFASLFIISFIRRNKGAVLLSIPLLLVIGTLLIATPVFSEFRYVYFLIVSLPFLITVSVYNFNNEGENDNG